MTRSCLRSIFTSFTPVIFLSTGRSSRTHSSQSSPSVAISIVSRIAWSARSGKNGSAGSGSLGRAGSIVFDFTYLTCDSRAAVAFRDAVILNEVKDLTLDYRPPAHLCDLGSSARSLACARDDCQLVRDRFEHAPDDFGKNLLPGCVGMNAIG